MDIIELKTFIQDTEQALVDKGYYRIEVVVRLGDQKLDEYRREFTVLIYFSPVDCYSAVKSESFYVPYDAKTGIDSIREVMAKVQSYVANMPSMEIAVANIPITKLESVMETISTVGLDSGSESAGFAADELTASIQAAVAKYKSNLHGNGLLITHQS